MFYQLYMQTILCGKMIQQLKKEKKIQNIHLSWRNHKSNLSLQVM